MSNETGNFRQGSCVDEEVKHFKHVETISNPLYHISCKRKWIFRTGNYFTYVKITAFELRRNGRRSGGSNKN